HDALPIYAGDLELILLIGETDDLAVAKARQPRGGARNAPRRRAAPGFAAKRWAAPQSALEDVAHDVIDVEGSVRVERAEAEPVQIERRAAVARQSCPVIVDVGEDRLRRLCAVLGLEEQRERAREIRVLHGDARDVAAMQVLERRDRARIDPAGAR